MSKKSSGIFDAAVHSIKTGGFIARLIGYSIYFIPFFLIGKNHIGALVTVVDRKSKFTIIKNIPSKEARIVTQALIEMTSVAP